MEQVRVERLDHLGLIASVIKDLGLIAMLDRRLVPDEQEVITPGEAVARMILNGLGLANRPLSLTPQFFANKPLDLLWREGIPAEMCNRFQLGRTLDEAYAYGGTGAGGLYARRYRAALQSSRPDQLWSHGRVQP
jgi:hypothetical protein